MIYYNTQNKHIEYSNDEEFRACIRDIFNMKKDIDNYPDLDAVTRDENNYDIDAATKSMDYIFEKTKDIELFQTLYDLAAAKMLSVDRSIGLAILFSYDNMKTFHTIYSQISSSQTLNEVTDSYQNLYSFLEDIAPSSDFNNANFLTLNLRIKDEAGLFNQHVSLYNSQLSVFPKHKVAKYFNLTQLSKFNI